MNKDKYFIKCINQKKYMDKKWVNRAFSIVRENSNPDELKDLDLIQTPNGHQFYDLNTKTLLPIEDSIIGESLYKATDEITVLEGELYFANSNIVTTYGRILYHYIVFYYPFNGSVEFKNEPINLDSFEEELAKKLVDEPEEDIDESIVYTNKFFPSQIEKYYKAVAYTKSFSMLFVPAITPKSLSVSEEVLKRREEIFNDPKIDLNDPVVAAQVEKELIDLDMKALKDDPASGFLINKKDINSRKKRYISFGAPPESTAGKETIYIKRSLNEGIDINRFKDYANEMRSGSYSRGVETQHGGELDKWLVRESSNIEVSDIDCGSNVGIPTLITDFNKLKMIGYYILENNKSILLNEDNIGNYIDKVVKRRSPATCKTKAPDFCAYCLGEKLSMNPDAVSLAFSQIGHDFMGESMSAMHGKALTSAKFDLVDQAR